MKKEVLDKIASSHIPIPICIVNKSGKIISANKYIEQVFLYRDIEDQDFFALTGVRTKDLTVKNNGKYVIERNGRRFAVVTDPGQGDESGDIIVFFRDVTLLEELKQRYDSERVCICRINIDNYDQFQDTVEPDTDMSVTGKVDRIIRV